MDLNWQLARKRPVLEQRARILQRIRAFFVADGFVEVTTAHRIPGNAPECHIDPEEAGDWYLHTSPELCMKRLLAAGYAKIFQICQCWRKGERGRLHLPEFTLLEWYRSDTDYQTLMTDCQRLLAALAPEGRLTWQGETIDLSPPWEVLTVAEAFRRHAGMAVERALADDRFEELLSERVEPALGRPRPTLLCDYPLPLAALARRKPGQPDVAERFELYIAGMELANGFSELTDPDEQRRRFEAEERARRAAGKPAVPSAERFLAELEHLDRAAGIALGVDRLVMLLTGRTDIAEVVAFPPEAL
ncbi:lysyl-tRNA synthetase class 2 [Geothermobacter ehrlichii]|uniref:Lysyl-tRNA synthetase class 2 n=1 Tax=Geothermobacter ehrlichii TaxID=213224 RepID=A0A5D3WKS4_9BACT|nr:EF-P lysine aminoacylase EpmA [Geothermobacter ehrlichii]TYO98988.1 lysyl-tRNA synthetase class 2 [Geothermobacter ehrlichii]